MSNLKMVWRALAAVFASGAMAVASAATTELVNDVDLRLQTAASAAQVQIRPMADVGNITVIELDGEYARPLTSPRIDVAHTYYTRHPDDVDFLIVFTTFEFDTGPATAFYSAIRNDVTGIGIPPVDNGAAFGSPQRLQGYIDMAATGRYALNPSDVRYPSTLNVLAHEVMHRWVAAVPFRQANGSNSNDLLGRDGNHWSYFLDSDASVMYGSDWTRRDDGKYVATDVNHRYSPLDLYLAGFAAASEVPPMALLRNAEGVATGLPVLGAITAAQTESVSIDQIVAAAGPRSPDVQASQREFRAAIVLLKRRGESIPSQLLAQLELLRTRMQQHFAQMTDGRAQLRIFNSARPTDRIGRPYTLPVDPPAEIPPGLAEAVEWLKRQQHESGEWADRPTTAVRDTAAAIAALEVLDPAFSGLPKARYWLQTQSLTTHDSRLARAATLVGTDDLQSVQAQPGAGGGWGLNRSFAASTLDSTMVAEALTQYGRDPDAVRRVLGTLDATQNADGSFGVVNGGRGRLLPTLRAARLLARHREPADLALTRAAAWLGSRVDAAGVAGDVTPSFRDTIELYALIGRVPVEEETGRAVRDRVRTWQQADGSWGSVYLTATTISAMVGLERPDLAVAGEITATPAAPSVGERVRLEAIVTNKGRVSEITEARWFDGDPAAGGTLIGTVPIPRLQGGSQQRIVGDWATDGLSGTHAIWLVLDPANTVQEVSEANNTASRSVTFQANPEGPDVAVYASDITANPAAVDQFPQDVTVTIVVRNIGNTPVTAVPVRLQTDYAQPQRLDEKTVDLPARGTATVTLQFTMTDASQARLRVLADPENRLSEAREDNNNAPLIVAPVSTIDLAVSPADLTIDGPAIVGQEVVFLVTAHNRGTFAAPRTQFRAQVVQNGTTYAIGESYIEIAPGGSVQRRLTWRTQQAGPASLAVTVDSANTVAESDETNNAATLDFTVTPPTGPDLFLVGTSLAFNPTPAQQGAPLTASVQLRNAGSAITAPFTVALYAQSPDAGGALLARTTLQGIGEGAELLVTLTNADYPLNTEQALYVVADADHVIDEIDEGNNFTVKSLAVRPLPDLAVNAAGITLVPALPVPGQPALTRISVRNLGGQDASNILVRLIQGDASGAVIADKPVSTIPAHGTVELQWEWTPNENTGAVTVVVDPAGTVREVTKENNTATLPFDTQNSNFYTSERYISPNGDGIRDETAAVFRVTGSREVFVTAESRSGVVVRQFPPITTTGDGRGQLVWRGEHDLGGTVPDGDYFLIVRDAQRAELARATVVVDTDRSSVLEAVETRYAHAFIVNLYNLLPGPAGESANYLFGYTNSPLGSSVASGIYRVHRHSGVRETVMSPVRGNQLPARVQSFVLSPDGTRLVFTLENGGGVYSANALGSDEISAIAGAGYGAAGFFDNNELVVGAMGRPAEIFDFRTNQFRSFRMLPPGVPQFTPHGILVKEHQLFTDFIPRDPAEPVVPLARPVESGAETPPHTLLDAGRSHVAVREIKNGRTFIRIVDLRTSQQRTIVDRPNQPQEPGRAEVAFDWFERGNVLLVLDAQTRRLTHYSPEGVAMAQAELPPFARVGDYVQEPGSPHHYLFAEARYDGLATVVNTIWLNGDMTFYDPLRRQIHLTVSEWIVHDGFAEPLYKQGATEFFTTGLEDTQIRTEWQGTGWPLELPADQDRYPAFADVGREWPEYWPVLTMNDGARLLADGRVQYAGGGVTAARWREGSGINEVSADQTSALSGGQVFTTRMNTAAGIRARSTGAAIELSGTAADRNFQRYELEYAHVGAPNVWYAITDPSATEVIDDVFLSWVPPDPGAYVVRLTVFDRAGNRRAASTTVTSAAASPAITRASANERYISPNGDGVKESVTVRFTVRRPTSMVVTVKGGQGEVYRTERNYGPGDVGTQTVTWGGEGQNGAIVPDGTYWLTVEGFAFAVVVDTVAPGAKATFKGIVVPTDEKPHAAELTFSADEERVQYVVESSADGFSTTTEHGYGEYSSSGTTALHFGDTELARTHTFRMTTTDVAGNRSVAVAQKPRERLILSLFYNETTRRLRHVYDHGDGDVPVVVDGPHKALKFDSGTTDQFLVAVNAAGPMRRISIQMAPREATQWTDLGEATISEVDCRASVKRCFNSPSFAVAIPTSLERGYYYHLRLRGETETGEIHHSNQVVVYVGGIDKPYCPGEDPSAPPKNPFVRVHEFVPGVLRSPVLRHWSDNGPIQSKEPTFVRDGLLEFFPPGADMFRVEGFDADGERVVSEPTFCREVDEPLFRFSLKQEAVVHDGCDGVPTDKARLVLEVSQVEDLFVDDWIVVNPMPWPHTVRWRYLNLSTGQWETSPDQYTRMIGVLGDVHFPMLDTTGWPEGQMEVVLEGKSDEVWQTLRRTHVQIEKTPPTINLQYPVAGTKLCANSGIPFRAGIQAASRQEYEVSIGNGVSPSAWTKLDGGYRCVGDCYIPLTQSSTVVQSSMPVPRNISGLAAVRLKTVGYSGGPVCEMAHVEVDNTVKLVERMASGNLVTHQGQLIRAITHSGYPNFAQSDIHLRATEPVTVEAKVLRIDTVLRTLDVSVAGESIDVVWDGRVNGDLVADGEYEILIEAKDDCGNERELRYPVMVKTTPPTVGFAEPEAGDIVLSAIVDIRGDVQDSLLERWVLSVASAAAPNNLAQLTSNTNVIHSTQSMFAWSRGQETGPVEFVLQAKDAIGNAAEARRAIVLGEPAKLIGAFSAEPTLFSPNGDGVRDVTRLNLSMLRDADGVVRVENASGQVVATVHTGSVSAGQTAYVWNGLVGTTAAPDGEYTVRVLASDPTNTVSPEEASVPVIVDTTKPTITGLQPATPFIRAGGAMQFSVADAHFQDYQADIVPLSGGEPIASSQGTVAGAITLTIPPDAPEGSYALRLRVRDAAGNQSEQDATYHLDATPPTVILSAPADGEIMQAASSNAIKGSVQDPNLAAYTLAIATEGSDTWANLAQGTSALTDAEIIAWTPAVPDGTYQLRLKAEDAAGNAAEDVRTVIVDRTPCRASHCTGQRCLRQRPAGCDRERDGCAFRRVPSERCARRADTGTVVRHPPRRAARGCGATGQRATAATGWRLPAAPDRKRSRRID
ncbi:CARDB domain-containing protein [Tahibacter amnicola]|uniref:CARDB protein n=1 Tax=Tahibacter amnicola TaxID=2976241 RepID=A0ABY6BAI0_9GAMM|nr:CARDB domain-containing protein [Tahibacter amnicola]UXI67071.1 hypothetical protein N4264_20305 [Tahibacter amnicola]